MQVRARTKTYGEDCGRVCERCYGRSHGNGSASGPFGSIKDMSTSQSCSGSMRNGGKGGGTPSRTWVGGRYLSSLLLRTAVRSACLRRWQRNQEFTTMTEICYWTRFMLRQHADYNARGEGSPSVAVPQPSSASRFVPSLTHEPSFTQPVFFTWDKGETVLSI